MRRIMIKRNMVESRGAGRLDTWSRRNRAIGSDVGIGPGPRKDGEKVTKSQGLSAYYIQRGEEQPPWSAPGASPRLIRRRNLGWEELNKLVIRLDTLIEHYTVDLRSQNKSPKSISWYCANLSAILEGEMPSLLHNALIRNVPSCPLYYYPHLFFWAGSPVCHSLGSVCEPSRAHQLDHISTWPLAYRLLSPMDSIPTRSRTNYSTPLIPQPVLMVPNVLTMYSP